MGAGIGCEYWKTKQTLREKIRKGRIELVEKEGLEDCVCYFCLEKIAGRGVILVTRRVVSNYLVEARYFLDETCYMFARMAVNPIIRCMPW